MVDGGGGVGTNTQLRSKLFKMTSSTFTRVRLTTMSRSKVEVYDGLGGGGYL